jgi:hypothetical protein
MFVSADVEQRIFNAAVPVNESVILLKEILLEVLQGTSRSGKLCTYLS